MNKNYIYIISLLIFIIVSFMLSSCGNKENDPLTVETIIGRKYYTDKVFDGNYWNQIEMSFSAGNTVFLKYKSWHFDDSPRPRDYETIDCSFELNYPYIIIQNKYGDKISAKFTNNNTLIIDGELNDVDVELSSRELYRVIKYDELKMLKGWSLSTNPTTLTGPYLGWSFYGELTTSEGFSEGFGVNFHVEHCFVRYIGACDYEINYPYFSALCVNKKYTTEGYFRNNDTLVITKCNYFSNPVVGDDGSIVVLHRVR